MISSEAVKKEIFEIWDVNPGITNEELSKIFIDRYGRDELVNNLDLILVFGWSNLGFKDQNEFYEHVGRLNESTCACGEGDACSSDNCKGTPLNDS